MKCFYHADADGICAGYWVWNKDITYVQEDFIKIDHGTPFPINDIQEDEEVWIVDYSIEPDMMRQLLTITENVTWIDHHRTAIDRYATFESFIRGYRYDGIAGCMLTYLYTHDFPVTERNIRYAPWFTKYIADYDVWKFEYGEDTKLFQIAFTAHDFEPWSTEWDLFYDDLGFPCGSGENLFITAGKEMLKFRDGWAKSVMEVGFETEFEGHKCFAVNLPRCNSQYFDSVNGYDILMPFYWNGKFWTVSMYSTSVDVSEIAKKYAGGGHKGAAGFQCPDLPFIRKDRQ